MGIKEELARRDVLDNSIPILLSDWLTRTEDEEAVARCRTVLTALQVWVHPSVFYPNGFWNVFPTDEKTEFGFPRVDVIQRETCSSVRPCSLPVSYAFVFTLYPTPNPNSRIPQTNPLSPPLLLSL